MRIGINNLGINGGNRGQKPNLLLNSALDGAVAGTPGTPPTSWSNNFTSGTIVSVTPGAPGGGNKIRVTGAATGTLRRNFTQTISVQANTVYRFVLPCEVFIAAAINRYMDWTSIPAGAALTYEIDGTPVASSISPSVGLRTLTAILTVGGTGGTASARMGAGVVAAADTDIEFWNPTVR
jgi:hypothetical protein